MATEQISKETQLRLMKNSNAIRKSKKWEKK